MKRRFYAVIAAAAMALMFQNQAARAQDDNIIDALFGHQDPRLTATGVAVGAGATAGYFILREKHGTPPVHRITALGAYGVTVAGCVVLYPMLATVAVNRPLTTREAWTGLANCVVPVLGGLIVEAAFHGQPWYEQGSPHPAHVHHHKHHQK